ncbi:hypothetical protein DAERI_060107 [Deinococcus aerius]|uniref:HK97 gp10 family phage protein n=1 Tax=Deinococcus aerius TaxID=200253 RepID=A0A2I9DTB3_9DEIO|nr:HK97 gp10 family phage protein [Deinococcus aerius]GBF05847.1 hypothetical protein DAERI_060107 [Deinococcus aerius]
MNLPNTRRLVLQVAEQAVAQAAQRLRNEVVEELSRPGSGRTYGRHVASAPGDPPAVDTGRLRQSMTALQIKRGHWRVGTNVEYAIYLEFGTRRIAPRPFFRPAVARLRR